ncbi:MAG: LLM class F420-dependent oxidoreductase [Candidatus Binatia bacterium]|nr:MAG: LLM class F420-dependent oxidoreductase [Candidatus Binatia bacterium]
MGILPRDRLPYGMQLPVVAQSRLFAQPWEAEARVEDIVRIAQACDEAGFFYLGVCDHVCIPTDRVPAMSSVWYDSLATLSFLAGVTRRVRLLSYVYVLPYRHPLATAKAFATLDVLSGGRVILGVGTGHLEGEFRVLGVEYGSRAALADEAIDLIRAAWQTGSPRHRGKHFRVEDVVLAPLPLQKPRPPIWVGGSSRAALRRAAARGDGWLPQGVPKMGMEAALAFLREERARLSGLPIDVGMNSPWLYLGEPSFEVPPGTVTGSPRKIAECLWSLRSRGADHVGVRFRARCCQELVEQILRFGEEVGPLLRT